VEAPADGDVALVISARDLSQPGWCLDPLDPAAAMVVAGGRSVSLADVETIRARSYLVHPGTLHWIAAEDREYAAAEMTAALEACLALFPGPVEGGPVQPVALGYGLANHVTTGRPLLLGSNSDQPLVEVRDALYAMGCAPLLLDETALLGGVHIDADGFLHHQGGVSQLAEIPSAYLRPTPELGSVQLPLLQWADHATGIVVNRPAAAFVNNSKPRQLHAIAASGFDVPETLVTTSPEVARHFIERHGRVVFKSTSGVRSIATEVSQDDLDRLAQVAVCPTMFQRLVEGIDVRVHVVGSEVFAVQIEADSLDYRYAHHARMATLALDRALQDRLVAMVRRMGLHVAGVDLRQTPQGRWLCLEVNPSPGFTCFSHGTGQPIAQAIAALLAAG
jgi:glutathione synthase/RimK-type ligase-like ATP-grasp enzyme